MKTGLYKVVHIGNMEDRLILPNSKLAGKVVAVVGILDYPTQNIHDEDKYTASVEVVLQNSDFKSIYKKLIYRSFFLIDVTLVRVSVITESLAKFKTEVSERGYDV